MSAITGIPEWAENLLEMQNNGTIYNLRFESDGDNIHAYFTPTKPINYIKFGRIVLNSNITFEEVVGKQNENI